MAAQSAGSTLRRSSKSMSESRHVSRSTTATKTRISGRGQPRSFSAASVRWTHQAWAKAREEDEGGERERLYTAQGLDYAMYQHPCANRVKRSWRSSRVAP